MMELISKEVVRRIIDSERTREQMLEMVESAVADDSSTELSTEQTDSSTESSTESSTGTFDDDCISRSEAMRIASGYCHWSRIPEELAKLPSVKSKEITGKWKWKQGEIDWYKLGKCIEEGFRKGLSNDRK